ncbi:DUF6838 family protein [uncultured Fusobacterium sp.]|uniref:phage tail terminator family protein n=1 Tax=uncultured Fusobacterium sp. TaxID=159267 RepID=UPI0027DBBC98|nr:hypothetical protein [uncultured Fusobacterium sp.]
MINGIIAGIATAISNEFGDDYTIYTEEIEQGFKEPCFFIQSITAAERQFLNRRYKFNQSFVVQYFPKSKKTPNEEMYKIASRAIGALEYIEQLGTEESTILRGVDRSYRIIDGVLNLFVDYNFFAYLEIPEEAFMEILNGNYQIKE